MSQPSARPGLPPTALITHDVSNYNQTTRGYLEMLLDEQMGPLTDEQTRALSTCLRQCLRIQSLMDSIALLEQMAQRECRPEVLDAGQILREQVAVVQHEFSDRDIRLRSAAVDCRVKAEPQLSLVFRHLLRNAVQHNDREVVEIGITAREPTGDDPRWRFSISDNGPGVPPARREGLFLRLDGQTVHGSGLGLAVCKRLLERWGGEIWLEESPGERGAVIGLSLPAA